MLRYSRLLLTYSPFSFSCLALHTLTFVFFFFCPSYITTSPYSENYYKLIDAGFIDTAPDYMNRLCQYIMYTHNSVLPTQQEREGEKVKPKVRGSPSLFSQSLCYCLCFHLHLTYFLSQREKGKEKMTKEFFLLGSRGQQRV
jgi:hypothetical protein